MESKLLSKLVELYLLLPGAYVRDSDKIESQNSFLFSKELLDLLESIVTICPAIDGNIQVEIDYSYFSTVGELKDKIDDEVESFSLSFSYRKGLVPAIFFYLNIKDLISSASAILSTTFELPKYFYLTDSSYVSVGETDNEDILKLRNLLEWFSLFDDVANISNKKGSVKELVFIVKADGDRVTKPTHFETLITPDVADIKNVPSLGHFSELKSQGTSEDLHLKEKRQFFSMALVEILRGVSSSEKSCTFWVGENIDALRNLYYEYYELFIENFAINEFRRELEEARFSYVEKIESVIGNIQGKLYVIPASFIAMGGLNKLDSPLAAILALFGIMLGSVFTLLMVRNQSHRVEFLEKSLDFVFEKYKRRSEDENHGSNLISTIENVKGSLLSMLRGKRDQILWYSIAAVLPFVFSVFVFYFKYRDEFFSFFVKFLLDF